MNDLNSTKNERRSRNALRSGRVKLSKETRTAEQVRIDREAYEAKLRARGWKGDTKAVIRGMT